VTDPRVGVVERGYDEIAERFLDWAQRIEGDPRLEWLGELVSRLPAGARVLELGCGAGEPCMRLLAERFRVTGIDISARQIELARNHVPQANLVRANFLELELPAGFDAVCSFYVLNHVPREQLRGLISKIAGWLRPGGLFMHAFATGDTPAWIGSWLGTTMFFSGFEPSQNRRLVKAAGLAVLRDEVVTFTEPDYGRVAFQWLLARG
jgi:cyclopropane fatty-acyl-phospholipid synthase-like methyltransferase